MLRGYLGFLALVWAGIGLVLLVMPEALEGYAGVRAESGVAKAEQAGAGDRHHESSIA